MLAEVVAAYFPALVELHNYGPANSIKQKIYNFETLNTRVLKKIGYQIPRSSIEDIVKCRPGAVESVLNSLQLKMARYREKKAMQGGADTPREPSIVSRTPGGAPNSARSNAAAKGPGGKGAKSSVMASVDEEILMEKETQIRELQETVEILELKVAKLEQLVRLKDTKLQKILGGK
tara:strand:+ start:360 stop:890 length:531 start_codon:yes stop_codon:yes gene_type:complete